MLYLLGKRRAPPELMMRELLETAAVLLDEPLLASAPAETWKKIIEAVVSRWKRPEKLILVLDEFQWIAEKSPELISVLQELWDRSWKRSGRMFLILCGSYIGFMEREVLGKKSPLFGRRTGQILLRAFNHREAARFHPGASLMQKAMTYFICGGVPAYLQFFDENQSVLQNIERVLLSEQAPLYREPDFLLREELRELETYYMILLALADGAARSRDIARRAATSERSITYYLRQLLDLKYIAKHYPLTDKPTKVRDVRYRLHDPLLRFWFHFIFPHESLIAQLGPQRASAQVIQPNLEAYFGGCFENLCRESLPILYEEENVFTTFNVGSYWDATTQIDVVGLRQDGWTDLGECKWGVDATVAMATDELEKKIVRYPNTRQATIGRRVFLRALPPARRALPANVRLHTLKDLYGE